MKKERVENLVTFATKFTEATPAQAEGLKSFAEKDYEGAKKFVDGLKPKPSNTKINGPDHNGLDPKFFKEDGKEITYKDILNDASLAKKFSETELAELKKKSNLFQ